jgi:hypothetical protein
MASSSLLVGASLGAMGILTDFGEVGLRRSLYLQGRVTMDHERIGTTATLITDEELTALAMAADPKAPLDPAAVPWTPQAGSSPELLPDWYMPTPRTVRGGSWPGAVVALIIVGFLVIDAFGLCITSGFLSFA